MRRWNHTQLFAVTVEILFVLHDGVRHKVLSLIIMCSIFYFNRISLTIILNLKTFARRTFGYFVVNIRGLELGTQLDKQCKGSCFAAMLLASALFLTRRTF